MLLPSPETQSRRAVPAGEWEGFQRWSSEGAVKHWSAKAGSRRKGRCLFGPCPTKDAGAQHERRVAQGLPSVALAPTPHPCTVLEEEPEAEKPRSNYRPRVQPRTRKLQGLGLGLMGIAAFSFQDPVFLFGPPRLLRTRQSCPDNLGTLCECSI